MAKRKIILHKLKGFGSCKKKRKKKRGGNSNNGINSVKRNSITVPVRIATSLSS